MISPDELKTKLSSFPQSYMANFDYVWKWKIKVETKSTAHILDEDHRKEAYARLSRMLPRWQTYRMGDSSEPLEILRESLDRISEVYDQLRNCTLLDFESIPHKTLETVWHELGRAKEKEGKKNKNGYYYIIAVTKPLMLIWGQTLAFDSHVRKHLPKDYDIPKYSCKWNLDEWINTMKQLCRDLNNDKRIVESMRKESKARYEEDVIVPYGRFLDIYYWEKPCGSG
jgi:hypothetical protein